jgi:putative protease
MFFGLFTKKPKVVKVKSRPGKVKAKKGISRAKKRKKPAVKKVKKKMPQIIGRITHYFPHVKAGVVLVTKGKIALGDSLQFKGHTTDFKQKVNSMQINNVPINKAKAGQEIGLLVKSRVRHNDVVYKV